MCCLTNGAADCCTPSPAPLSSADISDAQSSPGALPFTRQRDRNFSFYNPTEVTSKKELSESSPSRINIRGGEDDLILERIKPQK